MLRNRPYQSPCNGDLLMTPNQLRLRAPSHKDLSTTKVLFDKMKKLSVEKLSAEFHKY